MKLKELVARPPAEPWVEGKIPWHEPGFSARMLREHLTQLHDRASRRSERIDRHVAWLDDAILGGKAARVLDLGCGPGLYATRLARLGHTCVGIDFSPASIAHARSQAEERCEFRLQDLREADLGSGHDLILLIFGEFNAFPAEEVRALLARARSAMARGGTLVLEVHEEAFVRDLGQGTPTWFTASQSVFSDAPHLCLRECAWHESHRATTERYYVAPLSGGELTSYVNTLQAYSNSEYDDMLRDAGFARVERHASLSGTAAEAHEGLFVLVARGFA
jgi:SAM-dependent methyltransferase